MRGALLALAVVLVAPATGLAADGDTPPRIAVVDVVAAPPLAERAAATRAALERGLALRRVELVTDAPALARVRANRDTELAQALVRARERAAEGRRLFDAQDTEGAESALRDAAALFEENAAALDTPDELVSSLLLLAQIFFATEREVIVRDVLRHIVRLSPDLVLDRSEYPGALVRAHDELRAQLLAGPLGTVEVASTPAGARVFLDGRDRGTSPARIVNVPPGAHSLVLRRPGYAAQQRVLDVSAFRVESVALPLSVERHPELERFFEEAAAPFPEWLRSIADETDARVLIAGRLAGVDALELRAWDRETGAMTALRRVPLTGEVPAALDDAAHDVLLDAIALGWIGPLSARRSLDAGGGILDESAPSGIRVSLLPGVRLDDGPGANFPRTPIGGARVALDRRLGTSVVATFETGLDTGVQPRIPLEDRDGDSLARVSLWYHSLPLEASIRRHFGVGVRSPFLSAGGGLRLDALRWTESMPRDRVGPAFGVGAGVFAGAGVTRAVGPRSAVHLEARAVARTIGVRNATLRTEHQANRTLPVDGGTWLGIELHAGWLHGL